MIIDLIIIVIMVATILIGLKKGLISSVIDILAVIVALILALVLCKPITNLIIENTNFDENLSNTISQNIPLSDTDFTISEESNLPSGVIDYINEITSNINTSKEDAFNAIGRDLAGAIITFIVFIITFVIIRIILTILKVVSKIIDKIPLIGQINKIGGGILGAIEGIIIIFAILALISVISPLIANTNLLEYINSSYIGSFMYNNNFILNTINSVLNGNVENL